MFELVSPGAHLWSLDVDGWHIPCRTELGCCSSIMSIESGLKRYVGIKSRLHSSNSFRLWPPRPVVLILKNFEDSMSSYPFRILNTCTMSVLSLLNLSVGRPKVVSHFVHSKGLLTVLLLFSGLLSALCRGD